MILGNNAVTGAVALPFYRFVSDIVPNASWGAGATVSQIGFDGRAVYFQITAGSSGLATFPSFTFKLSATPASMMPRAMGVMHRSALGTMFQLRFLGGDVTGLQFDVPNFTPVAGEPNDFIVHL